MNSYKLSVKEWVEKTGAIGLKAKAGRYGGTYAYKDIAFEFGMWISPEFKIYLIKEFERLKAEEMKQLGWDIKRNLAKINYRIHTDAIKENLIPQALSARQISLVYANEADVLNMALFGMTAKEWREANPDLKGNIRDYANVSQLVCLSNLENLNAVFINEGMSQAERLAKLNAIAISQMKILTEDHRIILNGGDGDFRTIHNDLVIHHIHLSSCSISLSNPWHPASTSCQVASKSPVYHGSATSPGWSVCSIRRDILSAKSPPQMRYILRRLA